MWNAQEQRDCPVLNSRSLCLSRWAAISTHRVGLRQAQQVLVSECSESKGEPPFGWLPFLSGRRATGSLQAEGEGTRYKKCSSHWGKTATAPSAL